MMFSYINNGKSYTDTSKEFMLSIGMNEDQIESVQNQESFERGREIESMPSAADEAKAQGIEFGGVRLSLNESNQNGIFVVKGYCKDAIELGKDPFPVNFRAEFKGEVNTIVIGSISEFTMLQIAFMEARQQFFLE